MKTLILFVALALTALPAAADDVREYGRATVGYSGESLHVAVSYDYAQVNPAGGWLVLQMGVRTDRAQGRRPGDLEIRTPGGGTIEAPTQSDVNRSRTLRPEVHAAGAFGAEALDRLFGCIPVNELSTSGFAGYTDRGAACEDVRLWSLYRGPTRNHVAINDLRTARLFVFFLAPDGWPAGDYTLVLRGKDDNAELPVRLR